MATAAAKTITFLAERYRRLVDVAATSRPRRRRPLHPRHHRAPAHRPHAALPPPRRGHHTLHIDTRRKTRDDIRGLEALGYNATLTASA